MTNSNAIPKPAKRPRRMAREPKPAGVLYAAIKTAGGEQAATPSLPASKTSLVLQLLHRPDGATIAELIAATGWLPHTTRAALTGLKKKGNTVTSSKAEGEERVYRVGAA